MTDPAASWRPPADDQLTWFRPPDGLVPEHPRPVDLELTVPAFAFGISRALESLYFPLYELRARPFDGWLYLALAPSEFAERDLAAQKRRMCDSALRFSRDIEAAWRRIQPELEEYTGFFGSFKGGDLARLRRVRANQWFAATRAVFAPAVLLEQEGIGQTPADVAAGVVSEARKAVLDTGAAAFNAAVDRIAGGDQQAPEPSTQYPRSNIGPSLPADAPRMYMVQPLLALMAG